MTDRPRIYYLLSNQTKLEPISGDRINEMGVIRALSKNFDVFYNGVLCTPECVSFGREDGVLTIPKAGEYDLTYVRANKDVFLKAKGRKFWFASPYDKECFDAADGIVCMTAAWKRRLSSYNADDYDYFDETYPRDMQPPKKCFLFPQVVKIPDHSEQSSEEVSVEYPKMGWLRQLFQRRRNAEPIEAPFVIRHFGPVRDSNYPHQLVRELKSDVSLQKKLVAECVGPGKKLKVPAPIKSLGRLPQEQAMDLLRTSDAIWYNQHRSGNIAGSLKVLEAMAYGVPILSPRWDARVDELGPDYPFFWKPDPNASFSHQNNKSFRDVLDKLLESTPEYRVQIGKSMRKRVLAHSVEAVAEFLKTELSFLFETETTSK